MSDINVGDLPPKSPEFYEMLPSLRSSPISSFQAREEENYDSFHVVPSFSKKRSVIHTYDNFLRNLESSENQIYEEDLPRSPESFSLTKIVDDENSGNLSDDFEIYLQNGISPTPVDKLYSTLPARKAVQSFQFPSYDENQRLENVNVEDAGNDVTATDNRGTNGTSYEELPQTTDFVYSLSLMPVSIDRRESSRNNVRKSASNSRPARKETKRSLERGGRPSHNDIERQRRNDMKSRFDSLKAAIPEIEKLERAPKIQILSRATEFINKLHLEEKRLDNEKELERKRNRLLLDKLVQLTKVR